MPTAASMPSLDTELERLTARMLSPLSRYGHVALLLAAQIMSVLIGALLVTEPALPVRTQAAFAAMLAIGLSWTAYAIWVLRQRQPLMAGHRVVAGAMAVAFNGAFVAGACAAVMRSGTTFAWTALVVAASQLALATVLLVRTRWRVAELRARRSELERRLGRTPQS